MRIRIVVPAAGAAAAAILAWTKSGGEKLADCAGTVALSAVTATVPSLGRFTPLIFNIKAPEPFFLTFTEVITGPISVPATTSFERSDGEGLMLRTRTASGPTLSLVVGLLSRKTALVVEPGGGSIIGPETTGVPLIKT